jgi:hypothetical protein
VLTRGARHGGSALLSQRRGAANASKSLSLEQLSSHFHQPINDVAREARRGCGAALRRAPRALPAQKVQRAAKAPNRRL